MLYEEIVNLGHSKQKNFYFDQGDSFSIRATPEDEEGNEIDLSLIKECKMYIGKKSEAQQDGSIKAFITKSAELQDTDYLFTFTSKETSYFSPRETLFYRVVYITSDNEPHTTNKGFFEVWPGVIE